MLERPLEIVAALLRLRDKYALFWRQEVSVEGPSQGSKLQVPQVKVSEEDLGSDGCLLV